MLLPWSHPKGASHVLDLGDRAVGGLGCGFISISCGRRDDPPPSDPRLGVSDCSFRARRSQRGSNLDEPEVQGDPKKGKEIRMNKLAAAMVVMGVLAASAPRQITPARGRTTRQP